ncbi:MAG: hypothetical protein FJ272_06860, partial [Planctomycetes bacterium]|nr:hypothetical protein [Planctomycetota bacterium]
MTFLAVMLGALVLVTSWALAEPLTTMPAYPTDPKDYLDKWDRFVPKAFDARSPISDRNRVSMAVSRNNGRQIARDSAGGWFLLIEKGEQALWLGLARGERVVGGDFEMVELVGPSADAPFKAEGSVTSGSMVIDREDRLHVVWCGKGALLYASRVVKGATAAQLREKAGWGEAKRLAEPPCHPGDILLDASGKAAVCYSREDTVYYLPLATGKAEAAAGAGAGMAPLVMPGAQAAEPKQYDPAKPPPPAKKPSYPPPRPIKERECQQAAMDLGPDGSVHLAFQREFDLWYARRTPEGKWLPAERAAYGLAFHPAIIAAGDRPLICFQYEGLRKLTLGGEDYLAKREGGGASIGFAVRTENGWRTDFLAKSEEIIVNRQGIWEKRFEGKLLPMAEEMWRPVLFRDRHGVPWALWQNTTRRWAYCARWLGDGFGEVHECRGPFNAPGQPVSAEKLMPANATDVGLLFFAANRPIFDRMRIPTLSLAENREVLFLDSL